MSNNPEFIKSRSRRALLASAAAAGAVTLMSPPMALAQQMAPPVGTTSHGSVGGRWQNGVALFAGVPYGAPTGPGSRFMPPKPPAAWTGVRDCTKPGPRAPQRPNNVFTGAVGDYFSGGNPAKLMLDVEPRNEECLVLDLLTPALDHKARPVMIYIHGGGYTAGSGIIGLGADRLVKEQDVVLVTLNHRLAALGYLYLADLDPKYADSGNVGHLDLLLALKWVRDNVANFGGDPGNVTIWGESGGGSKISNLLNFPAAKGLFHRGIVASGSSLKISDKATATANAKKFLANLGLNETQIDKLQTLPVDELVKASADVAWGPVVDGRNILRDPFSPDASPLAAGLNMLIMTCKNEATILAGQDPNTFKLTDAELVDRVAKLMSKSPAEAQQVIDLFKSTRPGASQADIYFFIVTERTRANAIAQAERKVRQNAGNVYMAFFEWQTPVGTNGSYKAFHTSDLPLEFRIVRYPQSEPLSVRLSAAYAAFARTGTPVVPGGPAWPPYNLTDRPVMGFDLNDTHVLHNDRPAEYKVWPVA